MPYDLLLPKRLAALWKIKIWDNEILEEPHATILRKEKKWRYGLRRRDFMDVNPSPAGVPREILELIEDNYLLLCEQWDAMFPTNPVNEEVEGDDN